MTTVRTSLLRPFTGLVRGLSLTAFLIALWLGVVALGEIGSAKPRILLKRAAAKPPFAVSAALVGIIGLWSSLAAFGRNRIRLSPGATGLEIRRGWLRLDVDTLPYTSITSIATSSGPLLRLQDAADLRIASSRAPYGIFLPGVKDAAKVVEFLLARRDSLRDLETAEHPNGSPEVLARLAGVLERIEEKMQHGGR